MYNKLYNYLTKNNILFSKQFGFRAGHQTEHAIVELADEITYGFIENKYNLGVLIGLSKAFDTVYHPIYQKNYICAELKEKIYIDSKVICFTGNNIRCLINNQLLLTKLLRVEFHKAQFWDLCYSQFMITTCTELLLVSIQ